MAVVVELPSAFAPAGPMAVVVELPSAFAPVYLMAALHLALVAALGMAPAVVLVSGRTFGRAPLDNF
jgi:hypothetical protein